MEIGFSHLRKSNDISLETFKKLQKMNIHVLGKFMLVLNLKNLKSFKKRMFLLNIIH